MHAGRFHDPINVGCSIARDPDLDAAAQSAQ
jgi:hypothetical protein